MSELLLEGAVFGMSTKNPFKWSAIVFNCLWPQDVGVGLHCNPHVVEELDDLEIGCVSVGPINYWLCVL